MWPNWVNLVLGLWIIVSAYTDFTPQGMTTNLTVVGVVIAALALWAAVKERTMIRHEREHRHA